MAWTFDNPLRRWFQDPERILGSFVREGMTVADIGCGMGYFSVAMAKMIGPGRHGCSPLTCRKRCWST